MIRPRTGSTAGPERRPRRPSASRVAVDAMGGDHAPDEVVHGRDGLRPPRTPSDQLLLVGDPRRSGGSPGDAPAERRDRPREPGRRDGRASGEGAAREEGRLDPRRDGSRRSRAAPTRVVTAGHTGAGMAAAVLRLGRLPGVDRPALAVQMVTDAGPFVLLDIGANPDSTGENLAQYARMGSIFAERVLGVANPRVALLSIGEEKGKGDARIQQATELLDEYEPRLRRQRRGQGPRPPPGRRRRLRRGPGQRRHQVLRGPVRLHLRPVPGRVPELVPGPGRVSAAAARDRPDPQRLRLRAAPAGRRCSACEGTVIITHGRARRRMIDVRDRRRGDDGPDPRPGAHRRGVRAARRAAAAAAIAADDATREPSLESVS